MPSILITGANGFVGPYLLDSLQGAFSNDVVIHACYYDEQNLQPASDLLKWHSLNISSREHVYSLVQEISPDYVIHLAAVSHVPTANAAIERTWEINVMGSLYLFDAIRMFAKNCRVIFISSSEVYGESFKQHESVTEDCCLQPLNSYAASKSAIDLLSKHLAAEGMNIIRLRPFNHIGPGQTDNFVVPAFASQVAKIEAGIQPPVIKVGNLSAIRDFLDVRDVVNAYTRVVQNFDRLKNGAAYNISSGRGYKIESLLDSLCNMAQVEVVIEKDPGRMRNIEIERAVGDSSLLQKSIEWIPEYSLEQSLQDVLTEWRQKYH